MIRGEKKISHAWDLLKNNSGVCVGGGGGVRVGKVGRNIKQTRLAMRR